jgi:hypothetical protein
VCLKIDAAFETTMMTSSSELILSQRPSISSPFYCCKAKEEFYVQTIKQGLTPINVFLRDSPKLHQDNTGLILYQIKNDPSYSKNPQQKLFDVMDPYDLKMIEVDAPAVPLIKIVFALAARTPSLNVVHHSPTKAPLALMANIM